MSRRTSNQHERESIKVGKQPAIEQSLNSMKRMAPQSMQDDEVPVPGALMCHIMMLSSVIERMANRNVEACGLTFPQWMAIGCVGHAGEEGIPHTELGQRLMLSKAPITGLVDRLERSGYVKRVADPRDRRVSRVVMTPEGEQSWREVRQTLRTHAQDLCSVLEESEQEQLLGLLSRLLKSMADVDPTLSNSQLMHCVRQKEQTTDGRGQNEE